MNPSTTYICNRCIRSLGRHSQATRFRRPTSVLPQSRRYTSKPIPQDGRPFRMAVIGSGPAGFYTAYKVMAKIENAKIDMYEYLPTPFGLVRYGVAPDHPEVKNCQEKFQEVAESPNFNFVGNINIGSGSASLPLESLLPHYDAILFAYGASKDKKLGIEGEGLKGIYSARAFVGWYNGLPEYAGLAPDLSRGEEAVVIGQGNVALDVTRILLSDVGALRKTDITQEALDVLAASRIKSVRVVGRRGPAQAAFTIKEIRELLTLPDTTFQPIPPSLLPPLKSINFPLPRAQKRLLDILQKGSNKPSPLETSATQKSWKLDFLLSPSHFSPSPSDPSHLSSIICQNNRFLPPTDEAESAFFLSPNARVEAIEGSFSTLPAQIAFRSIGYQSEALSGFEDPEVDIPFDIKRGVIPNDGVGRIIRRSNAGPENHDTIPGMYCAGWVKRGPTGVIASTMADAFDTADAIARDWLSMDRSFLRRPGGDGWEGVRDEAERRGCRRVSWADWMKIDGVERERGRALGKEREKFRRVEDMLAVLD